MRDKFYSDNRELVKWAVLHRLAEIYKARRILQLAFYRASEFPKVAIDGKEHKIPQEVLSHFRDLRKIQKINSEIQVAVFDNLFNDRSSYLKSVKNFLSKFQEETCVVFLDPDTRLEPQNPSLDHVLESEAKAIWEAAKSGDVYIFYQHRTNLAGRP
jgi:predicted enzyme involved in methoxymalonyl-ACP biosynthesis